MREKLRYAQVLCIKSAGRAMQSTGMIWPGARIGVAVSGGMDSFVLLKVLQFRQRIVPFPFEIVALHVNPGFDPDNHKAFADWLRLEGIPGILEVSDHGPRAHSEENLKNSPCFYCSRLRRKRLFDMCAENGLTHLAFGHNADDLVSNFLMNLLQNGKVDGMSMNEDFFQGRLRVIRPLLMVEKQEIAKAARQWDLPVWSNPCPSAGKTNRAAVMSALDGLCRQDKAWRKNFFKGLVRRQWEIDKNKTHAVPDAAGSMPEAAGQNVF